MFPKLIVKDSTRQLAEWNFSWPLEDLEGIDGTSQQWDSRRILSFHINFPQQKIMSKYYYCEIK